MTRLVDSRRRVIAHPDHLPGSVRAPAPASASDQPLGDYLERVTKYVPVEIIAAFMLIRGLVESQGAPPPSLEIILYIALVVLTPLYLMRMGGDVPSKTRQAAIATGSFVVWSYAIGGPFFWGAIATLAGVDLNKVVYLGSGGALAVIWSLVAGLARPDER